MEWMKLFGIVGEDITPDVINKVVIRGKQKKKT